jgi:hypothetical protein
MDWKERWPTRALVFHYRSVCTKPGQWGSCVCVLGVSIVLLYFETVPTVWYFCFSFDHVWDIEISVSSECSFCRMYGDINLKSSSECSLCRMYGDINLKSSSECSFCGLYGDINLKSEVSRRDWQGPKWRVIMNGTNIELWERQNVFWWYKLMTVCSLN